MSIFDETNGKQIRHGAPGCRRLLLGQRCVGDPYATAPGARAARLRGLLAAGSSTTRQTALRPADGCSRPIRDWPASSPRPSATGGSPTSDSSGDWSRWPKTKDFRHSSGPRSDRTRSTSRGICGPVWASRSHPTRCSTCRSNGSTSTNGNSCSPSTHHPLQPAPGQSLAGPRPPHDSLQRQGGARLLHGQADHQADSADRRSESTATRSCGIG